MGTILERAVPTRLRPPSARRKAKIDVGQLKAHIDIVQVVSSYVDIKQAQGLYRCCCPFHDDTMPSFVVYPHTQSYFCFGCRAGGDVIDFVMRAERVGFKGAIEQLAGHWQGGGGNMPTKTTANVPSMGITLAKYAESKRLPVDHLLALKLADMYYVNQPAIRMPYFDTSGKLCSTRFRLTLKGNQKVISKSKSKVALYGLWLLPGAKERGYVIIVEGESDCHTLSYHDEPVLGLPGANVWRDEWAEHIADIPDVYVFIEKDSGGESVLKWLERSKIRHRVKLVRLSKHKDASALHIADPDGFKTAWRQALDAAVPWTEFQQVQREIWREKAWEQCRGLAESPDILSEFIGDFRRLKVAGEERVAKLLYLALTSRFLDRPVSVAVKAVSSAGKSYILEMVLRFYPDSAHYDFTSMSERALIYLDEPLKHRFIVLFEADGVQGDFATYIVRSLLSEGRISYATVEKTQNGLKPRHIVCEGPTGLLFTTTRDKLHAENETRYLSVSVTDTREQTSAVIERVFDESTSDVDFTRWHALQTWLELGKHEVTLPFGETLGRMIPPDAIRLRRDAKLIRNLICAHAILHQASRSTDSKGRIVATLADYAAVRELVEDLVAEGVGASVSDSIRKTVNAVRELLGSSRQHVTYKQIAEKLELDVSAGRRRTHVACQRGYLRNKEGRKFQPAQIVLDGPLPEGHTILPTVDELDAGTMALVSRDDYPLPPMDEEMEREAIMSEVGDGTFDYGPYAAVVGE